VPLEALEGAELGEDLVLGLLADRAGVEEDDVGVVGAVGELVVVGAQQPGHPLRVVLVHLAAVGDEVELGHKKLSATLTSGPEGVKQRDAGSGPYSDSANTPIRRNRS
jgi:hypothetical protein